ncbi:BREX-2 system phosphatase PglZ [Micromonospora humi]|uniref:PglZ domain-containing protein n=1 Tax=Micromonospora humi TaxID=745366 RepID=A0A1C5GM98_9ACTN|nr:BREX-2 system phosphatase PglZ [Micromonospora humi]SCG34906.1 PglZ domain-containing protein [Micromonospora humi]
MTEATVAAQVLRISPAALAQKVAQELDRHRNGDAYPVMVVAAEPDWPHDPTLPLPDGRQMRVVPCVSPLGIWEQLVAEREREVLVLLTGTAESKLGPGILSQVFRQRVLTVEPWDLVVDAFGARVPDSALEREEWAGQALLDAMPPGGWPRVATKVLSRDIALRHLAAVRLGLTRRGDDPDALDVRTLLRWSVEPAAVEGFTLLTRDEQDGLTRWLVDEFRRPARALFALVGVGRGADALPLGLVCDALWTVDTPEALRARGRIEQYFGGLDDDATVRGFADAAVGVVDGMLTDRDPAVRRQGQAVLDRAEQLLIQFNAVGSAGHSQILRAGLSRCIGDVAAALLSALGSAGVPDLAAVVDRLATHRLAGEGTDRVRRVRMAQRLVRWLGVPVEPPVSVADGVHRQVAEWGWVDLALNHVWAGEDVHPELQRAFGAVHERAYQRRRDLDRAFAGRLAAWATAGPSNDGDLLTVENLLPRVVDPLIRAHRQVLLVVLDGMSAAVSVDLADVLSHQWVEYDALAGGGVARRRGIAAALPTLTAVSRTSLFAGALRSGTQSTEEQVFGRGRWGDDARIFHKGPARGGAGEVLAGELADALASTARLVSVVINTVDDSLSLGREGGEAGWQLSDLGFLGSLLDLARSSGRIVVITSDHGHVLERGGELVRADDAVSARHRTGARPADDGEVELTGPRVVAEGNRIVALWDPLRRYRPTKAGYHGGASLGEVTIPLLTFLLPNADEIPDGWVPLAAERPRWWETDEPPAAQTVPRPAAAPKPRRKPQANPGGPALFDLPEVASTPTATGSDLVTVILASDIFRAQHGLTPRRVDLGKIEAALRALVDARGVLALAVLAQRAGELPARASGFLATLQRIFNVDNYPVLSLIDDGRTVRLDISLLRTQFGLPQDAP